MEKRQYTTGDLARILGINPPRVRYLLDRFQISPCGRIGIFRMFDDSAVEQLRMLENKAESNRAHAAH